MNWPYSLDEWTDKAEVGVGPAGIGPWAQTRRKIPNTLWTGCFQGPDGISPENPSPEWYWRKGSIRCVDLELRTKRCSRLCITKSLHERHSKSNSIDLWCALHWSAISKFRVAVIGVKVRIQLGTPDILLGSPDQIPPHSSRIALRIIERTFSPTLTYNKDGVWYIKRIAFPRER